MQEHEAKIGLGGALPAANDLAFLVTCYEWTSDRGKKTTRAKRKAVSDYKQKC
jgi:hypothetical protein